MSESTVAGSGGGRVNRHISFRGPMVKNLKPEAETVHWRNRDKPHMGVRVSYTGKKAFFVEGFTEKGKFMRVTIGSTDAFSVPEAAKIADEWLGLIIRDIHPKKQAKEDAELQAERTLEKALEEMLGEKYRGVDQRGQVLNEKLINRHLSDWLDKRLADITSKDVIARHALIRENVREEGRGKDGSATANATMRALQAAYNWVREEWNLPPCPTDELKRKKLWFDEQPRTRILELDELGELVRVCEGHIAVDPQYVPPVLTLSVLLTGRRSTELSQATWLEVNLKSGILTLPPHRVKSRKQLRLPLPDRVIELLRALQGVHERYVFPSPVKDAPIATPYYLIKSMFDGEVTLHDLRRTWAVFAEDTISDVRRKRLLGHSLGRDVTHLHYSPIGDDKLRVAANAVAEKIMQAARQAP